MKICTFLKTSFLGTHKRLGIVHQDRVIDANLVWKSFFENKGYYSPELKAHHHMPSSLSDVLTIYQEESIEKFQTTLSHFEKLIKDGVNPQTISVNLSEIEFDSPLDKIIMYRDFYAHEKHVKKGFEKRGETVPEAWYEIPAYYKGGTAGFLGNNTTIPWPSFSQKIDYELELGVVLGKDGFNIKEEKALEHIFGYTILNDISARDIQRKEMSIRLGPAKGKDWCSIMGPVIVTSDEFGKSEPDLLMQARINGELWSEGRSSDSHFTWSQMIAHMGQDEWIRASEFIGSGTVGTGCGLELDRWIQPGDVIELEIEKIGTLKNIVGNPK